MSAGAGGGARARTGGRRGLELTWGSRHARFQRQVLRRGLAAALAAAAVWGGVAAARPPAPEPGVPVLVAARDLAVGTRLGAQDLLVRTVPAEVAAWGAAGAPQDPARVAGRVLAAPVGAGEILTERRLHATAWLAGAPEGTVAVAVPVQTAGLLEVLRPGDRVRVLAPGTGAQVAAGVVLVCRSAGGAAAGGGAGAEVSGWAGAGLLGDQKELLLLAVPEAQAAGIAAASAPESQPGFVVALTG